MSDSQPARAPAHLWIVGVLALLWNAVGAMDYVMTSTRNEDYMAGFTQEQLDFFYGFPTWLIGLWAIAVWGSVLGSLLLLLRKAFAVPVLLVSFLSMAATAFHNFGIADGMEIMGTEGFLFSIVIFVIALALVIYSRAMRAKGVLT